MSDEFDVIVLGGGTAGLTAARELSEGGARVVILERLGAGGQVSTVEGITNFPGRPEPIAGYDLGVELLEAAEEAGAEVVLAEAERLVPTDSGFTVVAGDEEFRARAVVLAVGSRRRDLGVPGESEFDGRGVSHCASCDGPFYRGKDVVVVGGGDSAFDEAAILAGYAHTVTIVHDGATPSAREEIVARTLEHANVTVRPGATVSAIEGADAVDVVSIRDLADGSDAPVSARGIFVYVGLDPNTEWLEDLVERDAHGRLVVDEQLSTSRAGVFAAGDLRSGTRALLADSVSDGLRAARGALAYLGLVPGPHAAAEAAR